MPFLTAKFDITTLTMSPVLANNLLLSDGMKKKLFNTKVAQTQVIVQFTKTQDSCGTPNPVDDDFAEQEFVFIRKFYSVSEFL